MLYIIFTDIYPPLFHEIFDRSDHMFWRRRWRSPSLILIDTKLIISDFMRSQSWLTQWGQKLSNLILHNLAILSSGLLQITRIQLIFIHTKLIISYFMQSQRTSDIFCNFWMFRYYLSRFKFDFGISFGPTVQGNKRHFTAECIFPINT